MMTRVALVLVAALLVAPGAALTDFSRPLSSTASPILAQGAVALALALLAAAWAGPWRPAAGLFALLVMGQAAYLQLVDSPRYAAYQHVLPLLALVRASALPFALVLLHAAACAWLGRAWWRPALRAARGRAAMARLALLAVAAAAMLAVPTQSVARFAAEALVTGLAAAAAALNLLLLARALPAQPLARLAAWLDQRLTLPGAAPAERRWDRRFPLCVALVTVVAAGLASYFVFEHLPHIDDEVAYLFQAKYLARGRLWLPVPPDTAAFPAEYVLVHGGRWFSKYFPGWPLVLALGVPLDATWLVNPLLGGIGVLLAHAWVRRLFDRGLANATILLLALSPWLVFTSAALMAHPLSLALALAALVALERGFEAERASWFVLAGLAAGAVFLARPLEGVIVGAIGVFQVLLPPRRRPVVRALALALGGAALVALPMLAYNRLMTGRATYPPFTLWSDLRYGPGVDVLGFGPHVGIPDWPNLDPLPGHGLADVVLNANKNLFMVGFELYGWACGSLVLVLAALLLGGRATTTRGDRTAWAALLAVALGQSVYWFSGGPDLGARYWYLAIVPLCVLSVRGLQRLRQHLPAALGDRAGARLGTGAAAATLAALLTVMPWRAATKYYRYRGVGGEVRELVRERGIADALVLVRAEDRADYQAAFALNPPELDERGDIFARDLGPASRARLAAAFPGRALWVIGRPGGTSAPFRVLESPAEAAGR
jgi:hypothetical protein